MMNELNLIKNKRALVIVAHPDDETIWMGGTIRKQADVRWTIFSLCRSNDIDREPKFRRVCALYNAECIITNLDDEGNLELNEAKEEAKRLILENVNANDYDYIFTHGSNGEYGHYIHIAIHEAVSELIKTGKLKPDAVFYFNYFKKNKHSLQVPNSENFYVDLTASELLDKKRVVAEIHGYAIDGIDVGYCTNPEVFLKLKI